MSAPLTFARFKEVRALVLGDLMLDEYVFGRATRVSQEAPVLVIRQDRTSAVPGGAANVATNMVAMGASVELLGVVGDDAPGRKLCETLAVTGVSAPRILTDANRPTTRKTRVLANHAHQVLRIDHEAEHDASPEVQSRIREALEASLEGTGVLLISDYRKVRCLLRRSPPRSPPREGGGSRSARTRSRTRWTPMRGRRS